MWYPVTVAAPATEPVTLSEMRDYCNITSTDDDGLLTANIAAGRAHFEAACGARMAARTGVVMKCDDWTDLARLPEAPVSSIASISYVDTAGADQTLSTSVYELRADVLSVAVVLKYGQAWPSIQPGSRITVTAAIGAAPPADVILAIKAAIAHWYENRESVVIGQVQAMEVPYFVQALICNYRRNA